MRLRSFSRFQSGQPLAALANQKPGREIRWTNQSPISAHLFERDQQYPVTTKRITLSAVFSLAGPYAARHCNLRVSPSNKRLSGLGIRSGSIQIPKITPSNWVSNNTDDSQGRKRHRKVILSALNLETLAIENAWFLAPFFGSVLLPIFLFIKMLVG